MPPPVPIFEMMWRIMSFEHTPGRNFPSTFMRMLFGFDCRMHCEARAISTSLVPIPKATHPKAPWVEVWLSPQTMVMPGCVSPVSGPTTWIMPLRGDPIGKMVMLLSAQLAYSAATCAADCGSAIGRCWSCVGMLWSGLAVTCAGRKTPMPRSRSEAKACGLVTSCMY